MKRLFLALACSLLISFCHAQIYLGDNGLSTSGTGTSKKVSLGGTLNNAQTAIDFGSSNSSSNFLFKKGSTNYFYIANNGKIGIGTTSPSEQLSIAGPDGNIYIGNSLAAAAGSGSYNGIWLNGSTSVSDYNFLSRASDKNLYINRPSGYGIYFEENDTYQISIAPGGNVGIGIYGNSADTKLEVNSTAANDGITLRNNSNGFVKFFPSTLSYGSYNPMAQAGDGGIIYGTSLQGAGTNSTFGFILAPWHHSASGLRMDANGNIGIGKATPTAPLDVNGNIKTTGFILPTSAGAGKVLTSDASGNATWQTPSSSSSGWSPTGNSGTNSSTNFIGTTDSINLVLRTNNKQRASIFANGTFNIGANDTASRPLFRVYPNGDFAVNATNDYTANKYSNKSGIRYNKKLGILEVGISNNIDTSILNLTQGTYETSALIVNSDTHNTIQGQMISSILNADNTTITPAGFLSWSTVSGESHNINSWVNHSIISGWGMNVGQEIRNSTIGGIGHNLQKPVWYSLIQGYTNTPSDTVNISLISGMYHSYGGVGQFLSGCQLVNKTPYGTTLGNQNVDFSSLGYTGNKGLALSGITNLDKYPIFAIGNSRNTYNSAVKSNALTILYNGRTQINTTGYSTNLAEADVTPKAALEIVSNNSGILIPKLTTAQRDGIASGDLQNGLLLYNTTSTQFQFYNGSAWKSLSDSSAAGVTASGIGAWSMNGNTGINPSASFIGTTDNQPVIFKTNNTEAIRIGANGNIGIGTSSITDAYKLSVSGDIRAHKVKVYQDAWSDYVFDNDYNLRSIQDVEKFINKNKHLPDVPSAKEVEQNGLDLGGNQAVLLRKIEELTLYAIDQNKQIESQDKQIKSQNQQIVEQDKKMDKLQQQIDELIKLAKKK
ncbi:MAG: hypothetical protein WDO19_02115 [Bacteroidota bacterium]